MSNLVQMSHRISLFIIQLNVFKKIHTGILNLYPFFMTEAIQRQCTKERRSVKILSYRANAFLVFRMIEATSSAKTLEKLLFGGYSS